MVRLWLWFIVPIAAFGAEVSAQHQYEVSCAPCHGAQGEGGRGPALAVRKLPRAPDDAALASIITTGIPGTQMPGTRMTDDERRRLIVYIRGLGVSKTPEVEGNRDAGMRLFWGKADCGRCHTVGPHGGWMGPDLTEIGLRRSPAHLRATVLDPAGNIPDSFTSYRRVIYMPDNFLQVRAVTVNGETIRGLRVDEDAFTVQIRDASGRLYSFRKQELRELVKEWGQTPMPSYRGMLNETEIQDLVAYLLTLRGSE